MVSSKRDRTVRDDSNGVLWVRNCVVVPSTLDGTEKIMKVTKLLAEESASDSWRFHYKENNTNINATLQTKPQCSEKPHENLREMLFKFSESIISTLHDSTVSTQLQNHLIKKNEKRKHYLKTWHWCSNRVLNIWVSRTLLQPLFLEVAGY